MEKKIKELTCYLALEFQHFETAEGWTGKRGKERKDGSEREELITFRPGSICSPLPQISHLI